MYSEVPKDIAFGVFSKTSGLTPKAQQKAELYQVLSLQYQLPDINYLSLGELSKLKSQERYCPPKNQDAYDKHAQLFKAQQQNQVDEEEDEVDQHAADRRDSNDPKPTSADQGKAVDPATALNGPYTNTHYTPTEVYNMCNSILAGRERPCLIKPYGNERYNSFSSEYLTYVIRVIDAHNITRVYWTASTPIPSPTGFCEMAYSLCREACQELKETFGFDTSKAKNYNHCLAITKQSILTGHRVRADLIERIGEDRANEMMVARGKYLQKRIKSAISEHYEIYLAHCANSRRPIKDQGYYVHRMLLLLSVGYCIQPCLLPLSVAASTKLNILADKRTESLMTGYLAILSQMIYRGIIHMKQCDDLGPQFAEKANEQIAFLETRHGKVVSVLPPLDIDAAEKLLIGYDKGSTDPHPLRPKATTETPKQSPMRLSVTPRPGQDVQSPRSSVDHLANQSTILGGGRERSRDKIKPRLTGSMMEESKR